MYNIDWNPVIIWIFALIGTLIGVFLGYILAVKYDRSKQKGEKTETINQTKRIILKELQRIKNNINNCLEEADKLYAKNIVYNPNIDLPTDCKDSVVYSGNFSLLDEKLQDEISHIYAVIHRAKEMKSIAFEIFIRIKEHDDNKKVAAELEKIFFQEFKKFYGQLEYLLKEIDIIKKLLITPVNK